MDKRVTLINHHTERHSNCILIVYGIMRNQTDGCYLGKSWVGEQELSVPADNDSMLGCFTISDEHDNPIWYCEIVGGGDLVPTLYYNPYYRTMDGTDHQFDSTTSFWTEIQDTKNDLIEIDMFVKEANKRLNNCK